LKKLLLVSELRRVETAPVKNKETADSTEWNVEIAFSSTGNT